MHATLPAPTAFSESMNLASLFRDERKHRHDSYRLIAIPLMASVLQHL